MPNRGHVDMTRISAQPMSTCDTLDFEALMERLTDREQECVRAKVGHEMSRDRLRGRDQYEEGYENGRHAARHAAVIAEAEVTRLTKEVELLRKTA